MILGFYDKQYLDIAVALGEKLGLAPEMTIRLPIFKYQLRLKTNGGHKFIRQENELIVNLLREGVIKAPSLAQFTTTARMLIRIEREDLLRGVLQFVAKILVD